MKWVLAAVLLVHGLIHLMGPIKAFGLAELPQLTQPISRAAGFAWLTAALAILATAPLLILSPRLWWIVGLLAVILSQVVILSSWTDAKFGTLANVLVLAAVAYGFASQGPLSLRAEFRREVRARLNGVSSPPLVTNADLEPFPEPVRRYLSRTGSLGQPQVHHLRAAWRGRIRATADDPWMQFTAEQYNFPAEPSRFFLMDARRAGLPVDVFHAFQAQSASMRVRLLSLVPMVRARGPEMDRAETVTLLNDLALLAPPALIDPRIRWEPIDANSAKAHYTIGSVTVSAVLEFNESGELVDFVSDDRLAASADGTSFVQQRWSTPVRDYRRFGELRLMSRGEGRWHPAEGEYAYIELELLELQINGDG